MSAPQLVTTRAELRSALAGRGGPVAAVFTMGALHAGHAALVRAARERVGAPGTVVATVFVNPLQFGAGEDFDRYPRTLQADLTLLGEHGADLAFAPGVDEVYPEEPQVRVVPGPLGEQLEGAARPGHFSGVLTVVLKLLHLTTPDVAFFGEKDYQQLVLIRRMVRDVNLAVDVVGVPTVREPDGLALSSRNKYLDASERDVALALSAALRAGADAAGSGSDAVLGAARAVLAAEPDAVVDYLELRGPALEPAPLSGEARLLVAARVGKTRLIDNVPLNLDLPKTKG
ncbi:pantoate--beta-alanine ligase [Motilibacter aurantiacus]|uniref:pantoate--beta-alanine ligase n=1 Tax=Motilibacter aurantiacus TaxID=2714955 RepID=UPI00140D435F|nr:pantoate--beta-alanine ligase [Motilibacter aurantiacus]